MSLLRSMNNTKIQWATEAREQWRKTASYILHEWGLSALRKFKENTEDIQNQIIEFPSLGKVEPLLADRNRLYRSIVLTRQNKIIYYIQDDTVYIVGFWDTRREPKKQAKKTN